MTCLGQTFASDDERRKHFTEKLREKLQEPAFRKIEGFPHGADEDILNLSDPPYYTACPNPWIADFIAEWEAQKPTKPENYHYHREPFATDVSEGKNDPIYNAHTYHTKVPHKAIMRYILHFTDPGDIVFDGFCGTGMTGVAAQMCGDKEAVESLGYKFESSGIIKDEENNVFSALGNRFPILSDLSTIATFIAGTFNSPTKSVEFYKTTEQIIFETEKELKWLYETDHNEKQKGIINYVVWSEVFICGNCSNEFSFYDGT